MDKRMAWLRNGLLILVTAVILCLGWLGERRTVQPVTLPVTVRQETDQTVLERFRTQRDELELRDLAAL